MEEKFISTPKQILLLIIKYKKQETRNKETRRNENLTCVTLHLTFEIQVARVFVVVFVTFQTNQHSDSDITKPFSTSPSPP